MISGSTALEGMTQLQIELCCTLKVLQEQSTASHSQGVHARTSAWVGGGGGDLAAAFLMRMTCCGGGGGGDETAFLMMTTCEAVPATRLSC